MNSAKFARIVNIAVLAFEKQRQGLALNEAETRAVDKLPAELLRLASDAEEIEDDLMFVRRLSSMATSAEDDLAALSLAVPEETLPDRPALDRATNQLLRLRSSRTTTEERHALTIELQRFCLQLLRSVRSHPA